MHIVALALLAVLGLEKRNQKAADQLAQAKAAYQETLGRTGDFDCVSPEFDAVLKLFDAVPAATPARAEARDLARRIREKRAAAAQHGRAVDAAARKAGAAPPAADPGGAPAAGPDAAGQPAAPGGAACKPAQKRMRVLMVARKKSGKPPLGEMAFQTSGEVSYAPGAEPSVEEAALMETLKSCR